MRTRIEANRAAIEEVLLAVILPGVAGAVNASAFLALGVYVSHMTGHAGRIGDELALGHFGFAGESAALLGVFLLGAMTAGALVEIAARESRPRFVTALLLEALVLLVFALLSLHSARHWRFQRIELLGTLCFAMGMQNALVTRTSGAVVRTTHVTGVLTDLGIELSRWLIYRVDVLRGLPRAASHDLRRARLHLSIVLSFVSGATVGPALYLLVGVPSLLLPVALLILLAVFDAILGITGRVQVPAAIPTPVHHPKIGD